MTEQPTEIVSRELHDDMRSAFEPSVLASLLRDLETAIMEESDTIRRAAALDDAETLEAHAHRMASASSQFGFPELAAHASLIERIAAAGTIDEACRESVRDLEAIADRALRASEELREELVG